MDCADSGASREVRGESAGSVERARGWLPGRGRRGRAVPGARRAKYAANPQEVWTVLEDGSRRAKRVAEQTMERVRRAVFNWEGAGRKPAVAGKPSGEGKVAGD